MRDTNLIKHVIPHCVSLIYECVNNMENPGECSHPIETT